MEDIYDGNSINFQNEEIKVEVADLEQPDNYFLHELEFTKNRENSSPKSAHNL